MTVTLINRSWILLPLALTLAFSASVQAALEVREEARELKTEQILRWPLRAGDSLVVRTCQGCDIETLQVTSETRYSNGFDTSPISLAELLRQKSLLREGTAHLIVVFFLPDNHQVTRMILQTNF